jgi:hypothetical protein
MSHPPPALRATPERQAAGEIGFALVMDEPPYRWLRRLGLPARQGETVWRRAVGLALVTWLPIVVWAWLRNRVLPGSVPEPLVAHYGVTVTCLVAIPLLILSEAIAQRVIQRVVLQFVLSGQVVEAQLGRYRMILEQVGDFRDRSMPWVLLLGLTAALTLSASHGDDGLNWAAEPSGLGFGGLWFLYVARPIYLALLLGWIWRWLLVTLFCLRVARLDLALVPTHPDRLAGLGFLEILPEAFSLCALAVSSVVMASWTHGLRFHGQTLQGLRLPFVAFILGAAVLMVAPLLAFTPSLLMARRQGLLEYGALVGRHGRLVHRRWINHEELPPSELLEAPELGPIADTAAIYEAVRTSFISPFSPRVLVRVLAPLLLPALIGVSTQLPLRELLLNIGKALL